MFHSNERNVTETNCSEIGHVHYGNTGYVVQGLLELLWTVCSEEKLQSCLKSRKFQNPFNNDSQ